MRRGGGALASPSQTRRPTLRPSSDLPPTQTWATSKSRYVPFHRNTVFHWKRINTIVCWSLCLQARSNCHGASTSRLSIGETDNAWPSASSSKTQGSPVADVSQRHLFFYHIFDETIFLRHFLDVKSNSKVRNADGMQNSGKADVLKKLEQFEQNL